MSTYRDTDPCTDLLLDFVSGGVWGDRLGNPIGEADGNYNAVIGDARASDDLGKYTIAEILDIGNRRRRSGQPSSAMGRYQFINATLDGLADRMPGIDLSTRFTPEVQDRLAVQLLVDRGYSRWWRGQIDDEAMAHGLSLEWASLPDPENGGQSHYQGVGPNHASTTLDRVYEALKQARALKPAAEAQDAREAVSATGVAAAPVPPHVAPAPAAGDGVLGWLRRLFT